MNLKELNKFQKLTLVDTIEQRLVPDMFADLVNNTNEVIKTNCINTINANTNVGIIYSGVKYVPDRIKPLLKEIPCLPLHKNTAQEFSKYLAENRAALMVFTHFRHVLTKGVAIAPTLADLSKLIKYDLSNVIPDNETNEPAVMTADQIAEFHDTYKKALSEMEYFNLFDKLYS